MSFLFPLRRVAKLSLIFMVLLQLTASEPVQARAYRSPHHGRHAVRRHGAPVARDAGYADIIIDAETGRIFHASNAQNLRHPASLTKMMTLYITFQAIESGKLRLDQRLWVSENAAEQSPTKLNLRAGQTIRVEDAVLGLITESANDAAVVLGEAIGGTEERFAQLMTRQAHALGMSRTQFRNPSGLPDPEQETCAADMARLGFALIYHYPQFYNYFGHESFVYAGIVHRNHNHLMERYDGMDGIKTGYIRTSGFNLVASAVRNQTRLIGVVFGGKTGAGRDNMMEQLLDQSFAVAPPSNGRRAPVVLVGQRGDLDNDGSLESGEYLSLPAKVPAIFAPPQPMQRPATMVVNNIVQPQPSYAPPPQVQAEGDAASPPVAPSAAQIAQAVTAQQPAQPQAAKLQPPPLPPIQPQQPVVAQPQPAPMPPQQPPAPVVAQTPPPVVAPAPPVPVERNAEPARKQVAVATRSGDWAVQIGAYTDQRIGRAALVNLGQQMPQMLGSAEKVLQRVTINNILTYRARFLGLDEETAHAACTTLLKQQKDCLIVRPSRV